MRKDFIVFILSHGRPDSVFTYRTLRESGYTGEIRIVIDNEDKRANEYFARFPGEVIMFDKLAISKTFDTIDCGTDRRAVVYARNACFDIANKLGYTYFLELDDDYMHFRQRYVAPDGAFRSIYLNDFDSVAEETLKFLDTTKAHSVAWAQTGDLLGSTTSHLWRLVVGRKAMNSFFCTTKRPFQFIGRINEDVNTYISQGAKGLLFLTIRDMCVDQNQTQENSGGMTELYRASGTYLKSFFTVVCSPSSVAVGTVGNKHPRMHHSIHWENAVPKIISGKYKK